MKRLKKEDVEREAKIVCDRWLMVYGVKNALRVSLAVRRGLKRTRIAQDAEKIAGAACGRAEKPQKVNNGHFRAKNATKGYRNVP